MKLLVHRLLEKLRNNNFGLFLFLCGIFFLPSTLLISISFLLPAAVLGSFAQKKSFYKDKWNYPFLIFGIVILTSAFLQNFALKNNFAEIWDPTLSIIGLGNWLPFIWLFWALQPFLNSKSKRRLFALILIAGTFPVLITGFGQYFFNWTGPFETLKGLIIWYQRPIESPAGLSGLFNNQNYAGSWLNFVWPFCIALFLEKKDFLFSKIIASLFLISVGSASFLTFSRNAWLGLITALPIFFNKRGVIIFLSLITILLILNTSKEFIHIIEPIIPSKIILEFSEEGYKTLDSTRTAIILSALDIIKISPIFGIGAASFSKIYLLETNFWKGHSHNLLTELAISYGLPSAIILFFTIAFILILSFQKIFIYKKLSNNSLFDKAFWGAFLSFLISQQFDIQYFDGKISLIAWILVAGLKNIILEKEKKML